MNVDPLWSNIFHRKLDEASLTYFLKELPTFSELSNHELKKLEDVVHVRNYQAGEIIFEQSDPGSGMYMIRSGAVKIFSRREDGSEDELASLGPGDFFGETTLTAPAPRSASARTTEITELVGLFRADLMELAEKHATLTYRVLFGLTRVVSERLQAASLEIRKLKNQLGEDVKPESIET